MTLLYATGFEMGNGKGWDMQPATVATTPIRGTWSSYNGVDGQTSITSSSTVYTGFGWYPNSADGVGEIIRWNGPANGRNMYLETDGAFHLRLKRGNGTTLATSTNTWTYQVWVYVEIYIKFHGSTGEFQVKVNGTDWISLTTGQNTVTDGTSCDSIWIVPGHNRCYMDDFYTTDNAFLGDIRIKGYFPNATGDNTGLSRGGADSGSNYGQVDEVPPNDGTDYVYGTNTSAYDLYNLPASSNVSSIPAVVLWSRAAKNDAGSASISLGVKYDSDGNSTADTESWGSDQALSTTYTYYKRILETDPGSNPWTGARLDALQIGVKSR
jgi:hypothetical protein